MSDRFHLFDTEAEREPRSGWTFVIGAVVGGLVVAGALLILGDFGDDGDDGDAPTAATIASGAADAQQDPTPTASAAASPTVDPCQQRYDAQSDAIEAADPALAQWRVHVGAMNQLVTGSITLRQAAAFWNRTRFDAQERLDAYDAAAQPLDGLARCHAGDTEIADCTVAVHARSRQLALAERSLDTWRQHVHHMEMLRQGQLSPEKATRMWLASWRQGLRQLDAHDAAARDAEQHHC